MAKQKENRLQKAQQELARTCKVYDSLVRTPRLRMPADQRFEHLEACKKALAAKRHARIVLDALKHNRPVPEPREAVETKSLGAKQ